MKTALNLIRQEWQEATKKERKDIIYRSICIVILFAFLFSALHIFY